MARYNTPLRYPGGKQKLTPFIAEVLEANDLVGCEYAEPYAGGAGVAIELLLAGKVSKIHLNDLSRAVYCFWYAILHRTDEFCARVMEAPLTIAEWRRHREIMRKPSRVRVLDLGFSMFFLNRCNRSGIFNSGVIGGLKQTGKWKMNARYPREELVKRIRAVAAKKNCIVIKNWDAETFIRDHVPTLPEKSLVYCDPPYYHKAERLYLNHYKPADHAKIAQVIQEEMQRPWLVSYDGVPEVLALYSDRQYFLYDLQYNAAKAYKGKEVFVFSDDLQMPGESEVPSINSVLEGVG